MEAEGFKLSGPFTHENLTLFLIHGADRLVGKPYRTLQEAMERQEVIVHETQNIHELAIENISDAEIYIQSGDIVKGGKQDRVIAVDFIAPARSGKLPIASFCVERGRWRERGQESSMAFSSSLLQVPSKGAKLATRVSRSQQEVWAKVAESQHKLSRVLGEQVQDEASVTSLQLTLEHQKVQARTEEHIQALSSVLDNKPDVIGYAFAINGKFNSADVYASHELFGKLWPKLLRASAVEAVSELRPDQQFPQLKAEDIKAAMRDAQQGGTSQKEVSPRVRMVTQQTEQNIYFRTHDRARSEAVVHESWVSAT